MPYINLIQEQRLASQANERKSKTFFFIFVGALVASGAAFGLFSMETILISRKADTIEAQNKKNAPLVLQIDQNAKDLADLSPRLKTLEDAATITSRWDRILNHLALQTPPSTWLTGLRCVGADPTKAIQVNFIGVATAQSPIGEFIMRLQNLHDLDNVNLKFTNEKMVVTSKAIEFEIDSELAGTADHGLKSDTQGDVQK